LKKELDNNSKAENWLKLAQLPYLVSAFLKSMASRLTIAVSRDR
jgi:hypothetical protein